MKKLFSILVCSVMMFACDNSTTLQKHVKSLAEHYNSMCPFDVQDLHIVRVDPKHENHSISFLCEVSDQKVNEIRSSEELQHNIKEMLLEELCKEGNTLHGLMNDGAGLEFMIHNTETNNAFVLDLVSY